MGEGETQREWCESQGGYYLGGRGGVLCRWPVPGSLEEMRLREERVRQQGFCPECARPLGADGPTVTTDTLIAAMERALLAFGATDVTVEFSDDAPNARAGLRIAFGPLEFAYKVGMAWDGELAEGEGGHDDGDDTASAGHGSGEHAL